MASDAAADVGHAADLPRRDRRYHQHGPPLRPGATRTAGQGLCSRRTLEGDDLPAGLDRDGIVAPFVVDEPMNRAIFTQYVRQYLAPELKPGDIVILGHLSSHKGAEAAALIAARGARLLFLPPYSPDLNPIEMVFAKLKHLLRKAGERSREGLWNRVGNLLDDFPPAQCRNYRRHAGYASV